MLDGFPQTNYQAELLRKAGIVPTEVLILKLTDFEIKVRAGKVDHSADPFGYDMRILHKRLANSKPEL